MFAPRIARLAALALVPALCAGCASVGEPPVPVTPGASRAFEEAWRLLRSAGSGAEAEAETERAIAAAREALRIEPAWIAPRRFLDDRAREDLVLPGVVAEYRARLADEPRRADLLYLTGRLEGEAGDARFAAAARVEPDNAWVRHGLAWRAFGRGELRSALRDGAAALAFARDPFERSNFASVLARYHVAADDLEGAVAVLEARLAEPDAAPYADWLGAELARLELGDEDEVLRRRGLLRAIGLFQRGELTRVELRDLVIAAASLAPMSGLGPDDLRLALMSRADPYRRRLAGEWLGGERTRMALLASGAERSASDVAERVTRFALGTPADAPADVLDDWLVELPRRVLDAEGLPRDPRLARLVARARELRAGGPDVAPFGDALIDAGWFNEARAFASTVPGGDLDLALDLERRAVAGLNLVRGLVSLVLALENRTARFEPELDAAVGDPARIGRPARGLQDFLGAFAPALARARTHLGGESDPTRVAAELAATPVVRYGVLGSILHPGERFSAEDERLGRGVKGERVPGLGRALLALGRFGLFGRFVGGGPVDGTMLRTLLVEERAGSHLGAPWSGTIAWCDGADLEGRASRTGASIAGAALHEGYWIDVAVMRRERENWKRLADAFADSAGPERVEHALAQTGLPVRRAGERSREDLPLDEADRVRLAVMRDRGRDAGGLAPPSLDDLLDATAIHEEAHLCDRARWYPVSEHFGALFAFLLRAGFSPKRVTEQLESRAQLVALCEAADPRIPLVDLLEAAESSGSGPTPHAAAYAELLRDLLRELDACLEADASAWPELDPTRMLVQQLHHLGPERIRVLALALAEGQGLVERGR